MSSADGELLPPSTACSHHGAGYVGEQARAVITRTDFVTRVHMNTSQDAVLAYSWHDSTKWSTASTAQRLESIQRWYQRTNR